MWTEAGGGGSLSLLNLAPRSDKMANVDAIRAWVEDLRTTYVPQGRGRLRSSSGDCCLARACEVYRVTTGRGRWNEDEDRDFCTFVDDAGNEESGVMPRGVAAWFGVPSDPLLRKGREMRLNASELNDIDGFTYAQIADAIERTYLSDAGGAS